MTTKKPHKNYVSDMVGKGVYVQGRVLTDEEREKIVKQLENCDGIIETFHTGLGLSELGSEERKLWEMRQESAKAGYDRALSDVAQIVANEDADFKLWDANQLKELIAKLRAENK